MTVYKLLITVMETAYDQTTDKGLLNGGSADIIGAPCMRFYIFKYIKTKGFWKTDSHKAWHIENTTVADMNCARISLRHSLQTKNLAPHSYPGEEDFHGTQWDRECAESRKESIHTGLKQQWVAERPQYYWAANSGNRSFYFCTSARTLHSQQYIYK